MAIPETLFVCSFLSDYVARTFSFVFILPLSLSISFSLFLCMSARLSRSFPVCLSFCVFMFLYLFIILISLTFSLLPPCPLPLLPRPQKHYTLGHLFPNAVAVKDRDASLFSCPHLDPSDDRPAAPARRPGGPGFASVVQLSPKK